MLKQKYLTFFRPIPYPIHFSLFFYWSEQPVYTNVNLGGGGVNGFTHMQDLRSAGRPGQLGGKAVNVNNLKAKTEEKNQHKFPAREREEGIGIGVGGLQSTFKYKQSY